MLKKLLKYDLESVYKVLIVFYILTLFFGILTRVFFSIENSFIIKVIAHICSGTTISMIFSIIINNLMRVWVRFKNNFYGDESYLTHTLPLEKETLYLSKFITMVVSLFTSILVIALALFIAYYSRENMEILKNMLLPIADLYGVPIIKILLAFLFIFFIELANALQSGYTGIILGHCRNSAKVGFSVLIGFVIYIITQIFALLVIFITSLFNKELMNLFFTNEIINVDVIKTILYLAIAIYTITLIIGYFINLKLFKKGVNVD